MSAVCRGLEEFLDAATLNALHIFWHSFHRQEVKSQRRPPYVHHGQVRVLLFSQTQSNFVLFVYFLEWFKTIE